MYACVAEAAPSAMSDDPAMADAPLHEELVTLVNEVQQRTENVGLQLAMSHQGQQVLDIQLGMADRETGRAVQADTPFLIMSVTKAITGASVSRAISEGLLGPDDPTSRWFPDNAALKDPRRSIRSLIVHTAGAPHRNHPERRDLYDRHFDTAMQSLSALEGKHWSGSSPYRHPGWHYQLLIEDLISAWGGGWNEPGQYRYSSGNYMVLAAAIETASGMNFKDYVRANILEPLGLDHTGFQDVHHLPADIARNYALQDIWSNAPRDELQLVPQFDYSYNMGGGGLYSTARDLVAFGEALLAPGVFSKQELERIWYPAEPGSNWSYGWILEDDPWGRKRLTISGATIGVMASLRVYPFEQVVTAAIVNCWCKNARDGELILALPDKLVNTYLSRADQTMGR